MKRIWKSIGLAVLLAALLVGTGMADTTGTASVSGCLYGAADYTLDISSLTTPVDMGALTTNLFNPAVPGGSVKVQAKNGWQLTVVDNAATPSSKMKRGDTSLYNAFVVCGNSLDTTNPSTATQIDTDTEAVCEKDEVITYNQQLDATEDASKAPGTYSISVLFSLGS